MSKNRDYHEEAGGNIAPHFFSNRKAAVNSKRYFLAGGLSLALTGCAGSAAGVTQGIIGATGSVAPGMRVAANANDGLPSGTTSQELLVVNDRNVTIYAAKSGRYKREIGAGSHTGRALYVTSNGYALVANSRNSVLTVYGGSGLRSLQKLSVKHPFAMTVDSSGNLYVLSGGTVVDVFAPGSSSPYNPTPSREIRNGIENATNIAVDAQNNLYVANFKNGGQLGTSVPVYAPGSNNPSQTITDGISAPYSLALDAAGNLYVGNYGPPENNSITVYAAGTMTRTATITSGVSSPESLVFDRSGNLYVANDNNDSPPYSVTAYAANGFALIRTISAGVDLPLGLAFDNADRLYVANFYGNSVSVYKPKNDTPLLTITQNLDYPGGVALRP